MRLPYCAGPSKTGRRAGRPRSTSGGAQSWAMSVVRRRLTISDCAASSRMASPATAPMDMVPRSGASRASSAPATGANSVRSRLGASSAGGRQGAAGGRGQPAAWGRMPAVGGRAAAAPPGLWVGRDADGCSVFDLQVRGVQLAAPLQTPLVTGGGRQGQARSRLYDGPGGRPPAEWMSRLRAVVATSAPTPHTARMVPHMKARPGVISGSTLEGGASRELIPVSHEGGSAGLGDRARAPWTVSGACALWLQGSRPAALCALHWQAQPATAQRGRAMLAVSLPPPPAPVARQGGALQRGALDLAGADVFVIGGRGRGLAGQPLAVGHCSRGGAGPGWDRAGDKSSGPGKADVRSGRLARIRPTLRPGLQCAARPKACSCPGAVAAAHPSQPCTPALTREDGGAVGGPPGAAHGHGGAQLHVALVVKARGCRQGGAGA